MDRPLDRDALLAKIDDLIVQATKERSHHYVGAVLRECRAFVEGARIGLPSMETKTPCSVQSAPPDRHLYLHHRGKYYYFEPYKL
jgi:hypothetical protein